MKMSALMLSLLVVCCSVVAGCSARSGDVFQSEYLAIDISGGCKASTYPVMAVAACPQGKDVEKYKTDFLLLRRVDPGKVLMSVPSPTNRHEVVISKPYYIGVFEITQRQYELVAGRNPAEGRFPAKAVDFVSWNDVRATNSADLAEWARYEWPVRKDVHPDSFVGRLRAKTSCKGIDLPTEAQWVHACMYGMSETALGVDAGGREIFDKGRVMKAEGASEVEEVGLHAPNKIGLYDMHGNAYEWCLDKFSKNWTGETIDPVGPMDKANDEWYVLRGGTFASKGEWFRMKYVRNIGWNRFGFRIVLNIDESQQGQTRLSQ